MHKERIKEMALASRFKLKEQPNGEMDLNPYVYDFARALLDSRWISVEDRLPEQIGVYLTVCQEYGDNEVFLGCWHGDSWTGDECVDEAYAIYDTVTVTHWQPLAEPPEEVGDEQQ